MYHKYGPESKALRARGLDSKGGPFLTLFPWRKSGPRWVSVVFRWSDPRSNPSPRRPLDPPCLGRIVPTSNQRWGMFSYLSPPYRSLWSSPTVPNNAQLMAKSYPNTWCWCCKVLFVGGLTPGHTLPSRPLDPPCLVRIQLASNQRWGMFSYLSPAYRSL